MRTQEIQVYKLSELVGKPREKALDFIREIQTDSNWFEFLYDDYRETLEKYGFSDIKFYFSGFHSQGDGACFTAESLSLKQHMTGQYAPLLEEACNMSASVVSNESTYCHENTCYVEFNCDYVTAEFYEKHEELINAFKDELEDYRLDICTEIYHSLEQEYNHLNSEESLLEIAEINDYEFMENGQVFRKVTA